MFQIWWDRRKHEAEHQRNKQKDGHRSVTSKERKRVARTAHPVPWVYKPQSIRRGGVPQSIPSPCFPSTHQLYIDLDPLTLPTQCLFPTTTTTCSADTSSTHPSRPMSTASRSPVQAGTKIGTSIPHRRVSPTNMDTRDPLSWT